MDQDFYCACPEGFEGKTCERLKDDCRTAPCQGDRRRLQWWNFYVKDELINFTANIKKKILQWLTAALLP